MRHLRTRIIHLLLSFIGIAYCSMDGYAQYTVSGGPIGGNCGNLYYKITTTPTPCLRNGSIKIELWGPDVEGTNPNLSAIQYRAYLKGSDPQNEFYVDENLLEGKEAGSYVVEIIGQCKDAQGGKVPLTLSQTVNVDQSEGWAPLKLFRTIVAKSLPCTNTGVVDLTGITGGLPPYEIKFTKKPTAYPGNETIYSGVTLPTGGSIRLERLAPGDYEVLFKEGSACGGEWAITFNVPAIDINDKKTPPPTLFTAMLPGQIADNTRDADPTYQNKVAISAASITSSSDYYFISTTANRPNYYEYAVYYGETQPTDLAWQAVPPSYLQITMPHTISAMRKNPSTLKPNILLRFKGCTTVYPATYTIYEPSPSVTQTTTDCGKINLKFNFRNDGYGVIAYPFDWRFAKVNGNDTTHIDSGTAVGYAQATSGYPKTYNDISTGTYIIEMTDINGYKKVNSYTYNTAATHVGGVSTTQSTYLIKYGCWNVQIPCIYLNVSASSSSIKDLDSVIYVKTERLNGATWVNDATFPAPKFSNLKVSEIHPDSLKKYPYYLNPWANSINNTVLASFTTSNVGIIHNKTEYPYDQPGNYRHIFKLRDICGNTREVTITGERYYYQHTGVEPQYTIERLCAEGKTKVSISNWDKLIERVDKTTGTATAYTSFRGYISSRPTGGTSSYHNASGGSVSYISAKDHYIAINKEGRYTLNIAPANSSFNGTNADYYCGNMFQFDVDKLPEFELDASNTAMYRCPGASPGQGHIEISIKNGMGPYYFELRDENRDLITGNDTGIFRNGEWSTSIQSDYYWIYGYDYGCAPDVPFVKFEQRIKVYNLSNENSAWANQPIVCVGDSLVLNALALGKTNYDWDFVDNLGNVIDTYEGRRLVLNDIKLNQSGRYISKVSIPGCAGTIVTCTLNISVGEKLVYWKINAEDNDWFNTNNWLRVVNGIIEPVSTVPSKCTSVHIPGNAVNYPDLSNFTDEFGYPVCDTIVYHYGAETAFPNYLNYNRVKVQYNMGYYNQRAQYATQPTLNKDSDYPGSGVEHTPTVMARTRWYMISTPLKQMVGGDFGLAGYPKMYQRLFNTTVAAAGLPMVNDFSKTFNSYIVPSSETGNALALWIPDYDNYLGSNDQTHLNDLEGIIEVPYIYNKEILKHRPLHKFVTNKTDSISYFYYFDKNLKPVMEQFDTMRRGYQSYRFIYEDENNLKVQEKIGDEYVTLYRMPIPASLTGSRMMVGNPLMSTIDFDKVYELNKDIIKPIYQIITQNGEIREYQKGAPTNNDINQRIAPLQAFIIERINPTNNQQLLFHMNGDNSVMAVAPHNTPFPKARNGSEEAPDKPKGHIIIDCIAKGAISSDQDFRSRTAVEFNYSDLVNTNMSIFNEGLEQRADVFITGEDNFLYRNLVKNTTPKPAVIKFGLQSGFSGKIDLPISYDGKLIESIKFVDTHTGTTVENIESGWIYSFTHRNINENGIKGLDTKRFELHVKYASETKSGVISDAVSRTLVNYSEEILIVETDSPIASVRLSNLAGISTFEEKPSDSYYYKKQINQPSGVYLVQVTFENGDIKTSKIIVQ